VITHAELSEIVAFLTENSDASWNPLYDAIEEWANSTRQNPFTNSLGMEFVWIPPGRFVMGEHGPDPDTFDFMQAPHEVVLTKGFHLGKYPVTRGQFTEYLTESGGRMMTEDWRNPGFQQTNAHPVVNVSWHEAEDYCEWLSQSEGSKYRLPTETDWEYACRAGSAIPSQNHRHPEMLREIAWFKDNSRKTYPVGKKRANDWGLFDMFGNVWEWCSDYWSDLSHATRCIDPLSPLTGVNKILRGGAFSCVAAVCRASYRYAIVPETTSNQIGFRVIRQG